VPCHPAKFLVKRKKEALIMTEEFDEKDSSPLEDIESEKEDIESEPAKFEIVTLDFTRFNRHELG
jgi:hypothetical protein